MSQGPPDGLDFAAVRARMEETMAEVDRLLAELPQEHRAQKAPWPPGEATDASGTVRVVLAPDGLPRSIEVDPRWRRTVGCDGLAGAVTEACLFAAGTLAESTADQPAGSNILNRPMEEAFAAMGRNSAAGAGGVDPGGAGGARLALTVTLLGTVACTANPDWVNLQNDEDLNVALAAAVADIRANL
ncbi:MAG: hypothetical protein J2P15_07715 [Micromonosporaceae bacterium]|nr:hypothetical protein [Micromonosporaceae bacterium]